MKVTTYAIEELLSPLRQYFQKDSLTREDVDGKPPLRLELFSRDQMDAHARQLARSHQVTNAQAPEQLLKRLAENEEILFRVINLFQENVSRKKTITPAGEWLLDNFYLIEEQIRTGKRYLPKGYSKGLPKLATGPLASYPRVYDIAIEIISHSDGRFDVRGLTDFIASYQKVSELTIGELWAIPIMLRLALLENLRRVAARIAVDRIDAALANHWAKRIIEVVEKDPKDLVLIMADMARSNPPMVSAFVAEFARKLQWKGLDLSMPLTWIEQHLVGTSYTINSMVLLENQKQASDQLSVSNSISSLRLLAKMDWREFVEKISLVEQTLQQDEVYPKMDFITRDDYRHEVERISKKSGMSETEIARLAIRLAKQKDNHDSDGRTSHVGYYLVGDGVRKIEEQAKTKYTIWERLERFGACHKGFLYGFGVFLISLLGGALIILKASDSGLSNAFMALIGVCALLAASQLGLSIANWLATLLVKPNPLPKMDFSKGIPTGSRTLVVVPCLITNQPQAEKLLEDLEVRFLSNRDNNLLFALLTDFADAPTQHMPEDEALTTFVQKKTEELNARYCGEGAKQFMLFHRPRTFNPAEKKWIGYERKRGKLADLNHLLRGGARDKFTTIVGDEKSYRSVKYVITLDADTQLPRDAGWKLVGLMSHPLNHAHYSEDKRRITKGYGIIQPRIAISLHGASRSLYSKMYESDSGIDPYTHVVSDVYQDVFEEGSFIGKGIYEVDAFEAVLNNRFPENRILSHDLLEGTYARCGYASDVQLYEGYPSRYDIDVSRRHRWIRGDWQIAAWFLPIVPAPNKKLRHNPISALSRWKIFDNLRRSLIPIAFTVLYALGWTILTDAWLWTLGLTAMILLPSIISSAWYAIRKPTEVSYKQHFSNAFGATHRSFLQTLFSLCCLPYEAFVSIDAIVKTLWRIHVSGKKLLEWNPSGFVVHRDETLIGTFGKMWAAPVFSLAIGYLLSLDPINIIWAVPFLIAWFISPFVTWFVGRPTQAQVNQLSLQQKNYLRERARKTWSFFENLVTADDNWLPPDNLQQYPIPVIAHRTSPTNIGMALLSNLAAFDFGYSTTTQLIERTTNTFNSMDKLERFKGHFFNWYDTQSLRTLQPRYISTVDSGNLAGHLLTLRQGLLALPNTPIITSATFDGLRDAVHVIRQVISKDEKHLFDAFKKYFDEHFPNIPIDLHGARIFFIDLRKQFNASFKLESFEALTEAGWWIHAFDRQLDALIAEITALAPWLTSTPTPEKFKNIKGLPPIPTLRNVAKLDMTLRAELSNWKSSENTTEENAWLKKFEASIGEGGKKARETIAALHELAKRSADFADMQYDFLYDKSQRLLSIGFSVDERHQDSSCYDLLASEARLSSFVAIAQGKLPQESWFALGRRLTTVGNTPVLLSWSGSMFEYLMPILVMPTYENTLLDETYRGTVDRQIEYGDEQNVPWGISESCYNLVDSSLTYQYQAFGVPGLALKRGLGKDLVISPYSSVLALMVDPRGACENLEKISKLGYEGRYGYFEAIDYTQARLARGSKKALIQTFMVHHQGMSLLAFAYQLLDKPMQKRFEADPQFQTALLLLQERIPKTTGFYSANANSEDITHVSTLSETRIITTPDTAVPEVQLLSNGRYHLMITNSGAGYSRWREMALTRWREDSTLDNSGAFCYIKDVEEKKFWSATHQPTLVDSKGYEAIFSQGRAEFRRKDNEIETYSEIIVSPEDDIEVRRVHLTNHSRNKKTLEVSSYAEVVLTLPVSDEAHPAFSNLFVQTEIDNAHQAIICSRRPRSKDERPPWMFHLMKVVGGKSGNVSFETDRNKFIGRGKTTVAPESVITSEPLSGSQGSVLDPIVSIRYEIILEPGQAAIVDIITGISDTKEGNQSLIDKYQDRHLRNRAFELSWTHSQVVLRQIGATEADAQLYGKLAGSVIYNNPALRASPTILSKNQRGQSALWSYSISGDLPIVLLQISESSNVSLVKQLVKAQAFWHLKGLPVDLVILNEDPSGYRQVLQEQIQGLIAAGIGVSTTDKQGRIFVRSVDQISAEDRVLLQSVARVIISDSRGSLEDQLNPRSTPKAAVNEFMPVRPAMPGVEIKLENRELKYANGYGGFSQDGTEYIITTNQNKRTPLPWVNVIANRNFGTIVSESGAGYTWSENAHEYRLSPWSNDPVSDGGGEAIYIRDEETGRFWSPTLFPAPGKSDYVVRHGFGYTITEHWEDGIYSELKVYVDQDAPIKFMALKIRNRSGRTRRLSATGYVEWVLGANRSKSSRHIAVEQHSTSGVLLARNSYNTEFYNRVAFYDVDAAQYHFTADRQEFIGRNGTLADPEAMRRSRLSGKSGAGLDPCTAIQVPFELENGKEKEIMFTLGSGKDQHEALEIISRFNGIETGATALERVKKFWRDTLLSVQVETPDQTINILSNGWLLYQVMSCRLWGRSGFYQSGGAFGFRDQLQDVLALLHTNSKLTREQILLAASRQFREGDAQHWWHPPMGRGVRTTCSDDFLWLPYVTSRYVMATGDTRILEEQVGFIQGRPLNVNEESYYDLPIISDQRATLYDHCKRAIQRAINFGEHGLPFMGSGDWNDGMNMVGIHGKGESVWLGFFLYDVLMRFIPIAKGYGDESFAQAYEHHAALLKSNINTNAWDGNWYLRAFFDDGTPLGSHQNEECRIDSISQSWSILSGAGKPEKSLSAMKAVDQYLVNRNKHILQLLDPPFDTSALDPGYIKGYVPGVRENGGQYTHAAIWMVMAFAKLGDHERAEELLGMINPIHHGSTKEQIEIYKAEPYVMAADVYGVAPHTGRGGWTWYTGSAGWMYQLILESILGLKRENEILRFEPCVPASWDSYTVHYKHKTSTYHIKVERLTPDTGISVTIDGIASEGPYIQLKDDGGSYDVVIRSDYSFHPKSIVSAD